MDELKPKLDKYLNKSKPLFDDIQVTGPGGDKVKDTALRYYKDAIHFRDKGEYVNALAALEYAEGWLDAGRELGVVKTIDK